MRTRLLLIGAVLFSLSVSAQKKISIELNYPLPVGKNFLQENYDGIVDVGFKYRFINLPIVKIGAGVNTGMLTYVEDSNDNDIVVADFTLQPKVFAEVKIPGIGLRPYAGIGYTWMFFEGTVDDGFDDYDYSETRNGINFQVGLAVDIIPRLFLTAQYDFTKLNSEGSTDKYYNNVGIVKIGVGVRL